MFSSSVLVEESRVTLAPDHSAQEVIPVPIAVSSGIGVQQEEHMHIPPSVVRVEVGLVVTTDCGCSVSYVAGKAVSEAAVSVRLCSIHAWEENDTEIKHLLKEFDDAYTRNLPKLLEALHVQGVTDEGG